MSEAARGQGMDERRLTDRELAFLLRIQTDFDAGGSLPDGKMIKLMSIYDRVIRKPADNLTGEN